MKIVALALVTLLQCAVALAQPFGGYLQADSAHFRVLFRPEDSGTQRVLWNSLRTGVTRLETALGIPLRDTVTFIITPTREEWRRITGGAPDWAQGISDPYHRVTILKSPRYGDPLRPFNVTAVHELVHLLLRTGHPDVFIPRWLDEGLAQILSGESLDLRTSLISQAVLSGRIHNFFQIEHVMGMRAQEASLAYAESITAVDLLIRTYGWDGVRKYAAALRSGLEPDEAFIRVFGIHLGEFEGQWFDYLRRTYRFSLFHNWEFYLGIIFLPFLALAGLAAWHRRRTILKRWEEEERAGSVGGMSEEYPPGEDYD
jgi:hypothetical protein